MQRFLTIASLCVASLMMGAANADEIRIVINDSGMTEAQPIAIVPFEWNSPEAPEVDIAAVISADLARTGQFALLPDEDMVERPTQFEDIKFGTWRRLEVDYLAIGSVSGDDLSGYTVTVRLVNVLTSESPINLNFTTAAGGLRNTAHHIADTIYEELTGVPGIFRTRIAYVTSTGLGADQRFSLMVADADGHGPTSVLRSGQPILSPTWAPNGSDLAYVSFENGNSSVWIHNIFSGARLKVASFMGINGAPAFSPDGARLALTLSRSGNPEIYVMDVASGQMQQVTQHWGIDTEPSWTHDGRSILFTSDRGGKPQLYLVNADGSGDPQRLTRRGDYNANGSLSPDGKLLAMVHGNNNDYRIAILDRESDVLRVISPGKLDESPSFAPNGSMLLYASRKGEQGVLSAVPVLGVTAGNVAAHDLIFTEGDIREPAWSPYRR